MRRSDRWGAFRFGLRTRRLLSSGYAFARTWWVGGFALSEGGLATARAAADRAEAAVEDDDEKASRAQDAAQRGAAWLRMADANGSAVHPDPARGRVGGPGSSVSSASVWIPFSVAAIGCRQRRQTPVVDHKQMRPGLVGHGQPRTATKGKPHVALALRRAD